MVNVVASQMQVEVLEGVERGVRRRDRRELLAVVEADVKRHLVELKVLFKDLLMVNGNGEDVFALEFGVEYVLFRLLNLLPHEEFVPVAEIVIEASINAGQK